MIEFGLAGCYNEHAVKVSDSSCSSSGGTTTTTSLIKIKQPFSISSSNSPVVVPQQESVTCVYSVNANNNKKKSMIVRLTWSRRLMGVGFSVQIDSDPTPLLIRKKKGTRSYSSSISLHWDISSAHFHPSTVEPIHSFHVAVVSGGDVALLVGQLPNTEFSFSCSSLISRREITTTTSFSSVTRAYTTKTRLREKGKEHEIEVRVVEGCSMSVCVDKNKVVDVRRLNWNFRGNQTIFVDGLPVDVLWDVHADGIFMFRSRTGLETRLWLEEEEEEDGNHSFVPRNRNEFSLLIHLLNNNNKNIRVDYQY